MSDDDRQMVLDLDALPQGRLDTETQAICDLINGDPIHAEDRRRVAHAILSDAMAHAGQVHPNRVRKALSLPSGALIVYPRVMGPVYHTLVRSGHLRQVGWDVNDDAHGNNTGKPCRVYVLTTYEVAA